MLFSHTQHARRLLSWIAIGARNVLRPTLIQAFSFKWASKYYYLLISRAFYEEQFKVLTGISRFTTSDRSCRNEYSLRRNIHRIEKGLVMRPRRSCFAADYIHHTVDCYREICFDSRTDQSLIVWAHDVLESYFAISRGGRDIELAREIFQSCPRIDEHAVKSIPTPRSSAPNLPIEFQDILVLAQRRRSVRWYTPFEVERELIDKAIQVASYSPSACNRQPFEFRVYDDENLVRKVMGIPGGTSGWSHSPPVVAVLVGHLSAFAEERDRHLIYIDSSLAAMSFMFALESLGLSSCAINFPDIPEKNLAVAKVLSLASHEVVTMVIALGYADAEGLVPFSGKKDLDVLRSYNKVNSQA